MFTLARIVILVTALGAAMAAKAPDYSRWYPFSDAQALAEKASRPVMVYFWSESCYFCEQMNTYVLSDPSVSKLLEERFVVASVDMFSPEGRELASRYGALGTPTFVFLAYQQGTWRELGRLFGSRPRAQFFDELQRICTKARGGDCG